MGINSFVLVAFSAALLPLSAQVVENNHTVTKRFAITGGVAPEVVVSIVTGSIRVTAGTGSEIVLNAKLHYEAPDGASLADLEKRIRLESEQQGNNVWIGVDGETWNSESGSARRTREFGWRNRGSEQRSGQDRSERRWRFRHDLELQVPRNVHLKLNTVNGGDINVSGASGEFSFNNVNGGIEAKEMQGFGRAHTINGPVSISFQKNPTGPVSIKSINGKMSVQAQPGLNANVKFKTLNGKLYSDFAMTTGTESSSTTSQEGLKRIWRSDRLSNLRVGNGGTDIQIDGLNGDVHITQRKN